MPKLKTKKTLKRRIKISKNGSIMYKQTRTGHLKRKMDSSRSSRKSGRVTLQNKAMAKTLRKLSGVKG